MAKNTFFRKPQQTTSVSETSDNAETLSTEATSEEQAPPVELNNSSYSIFKDLNTGEWVVVEIKFDPITKTVSEPMTLSKDLDRAVAQERFKIEVANKLF